MQLDGGVRSARRLCLSLSMALAFACSSDTTDHKDTPDASQPNAFNAPDGGPPGPRIFATVSSSAKLLVIDADTHAIVTSLAVGTGPAIVLNAPDNKHLYTANWGDKSVSVVELATFKVTNIAMPGRPYVIATSPDGKYVYAGCDSVNQVVVIDAKTNVIARTFQLSILPASIIVSPDGDTIYVATLGGLGNGSLVALSAATGDVVHPALTVGGAPGWITIGPDGSRVYTLNFLTDDVTVVNTDSWTVEATVKTGANSQGIIGNVTPDGSRLYVTNHGTNELIAIDTKSNQVVQTIKLDGKPVGVNFNAAGTHVFSTDFGPESLTESPFNSITYLTSGTYSGTGPGQVREFDIATGMPVGSTIVTEPGPTSVVALPAAK
ncbi:MAG: hypothetical protein JWN48_4310 [Myxococcaceae bacterium]|nr:hypothetical protein [Myxococcaceae bacterium]